MKKILFLWAIISLCSCSVQRSATSSQQINAQRDSTATAQIVTASNQRAEQTTDTDEVTTTTTDEFDTSQPIDPKTGTPPVKRRTTVLKHKKTTAAATVEQTTTTTQEQNMNTTTTTRSQTATTDQVKREFGMHALIWGILGALAVVGLWIFWKLFKQRLIPF